MNLKQPFVLENTSMMRNNDELEIKIINDLKQDVALYVGFSPKKETINTLVGKNIKGIFRFYSPIEKGRPYFKYLNESDSSILFSERVLPLEGAINIRDMGGYETNDNRRTKWGVLYRGDQLSKLTDKDVELLKKIGLKTIIDFRSSHERGLNPNREISSVEQTILSDPHSSFSEAAAEAVDLHSENQKLVRSLEQGLIEERYLENPDLKVIESYQNMVNSPESIQALKKMIHVYVCSENAPIIQHCRGGKDRTGFGSMLLLLLLGVKEELVVKDYMLTGDIRKRRNALKLQMYQELTDNQRYLDYLMAVLDTKEVFITSTIDYIKEQYGSIENYSVSQLGLSLSQIEEMKNNYLEEM
ncbi:tyrosine-protein phosphatase [Vagococcus elongatus]|uniref:Tyrosine specific protein phosphatases domain-containing protein n=1 Tax=Vagococcus elongatus TaxID=180344 RepID=A0A430AZS3_9ENTE|nr:tyrosine-protein phosphatase [Vagococcus elongatus]RSU13501.1 hypothetical protein CBF29_04405 [Vagococcus elongatus]